MTPEAKVKKQIKDYLNSIGAYHIWPVPTGYGSVLVDCYACIRGRFFAIEVKAPGKKATARQQHVLNQVKTAEGYWVLATSAADVKALVNVAIS